MMPTWVIGKIAECIAALPPDVRKAYGFPSRHVSSSVVAVRRSRAATRKDSISPAREGQAHRHHRVAIALDTHFISQRLRQRLPQGECYVLDRMMIVDFEIALAGNVEIE